MFIKNKKIRQTKGHIGIVLAIGMLIPTYYLVRSIFVYEEIAGVNDVLHENLLNSFIFSVLMTVVLYTTLTITSKFLEKKIPWRENGIKRFIVQLVITIVATIALSGIVTYCYSYFVLSCCAADTKKFIFDVVIISLIVTTIVTAITEAVFLFKQWKTALFNAEKLKQENLQSQFAALKNQVNPHFLFNSLNTLATIIPENPKQAVQFVQKLSSVYRYLLQYKDDETVDLKTELNCIEAYFFLQKIRFGDNLQVNINVPKKYELKPIPPLTLQILVENAIKHNIISKQKPLKVDIYIDDAGMLVTRNNLQKKNSIESSTKIGLQNLINRFGYIYNKTIDIFETDSEFLVKVPLG